MVALYNARWRGRLKATGPFRWWPFTLSAHVVPVFLIPRSMMYHNSA